MRNAAGYRVGVIFGKTGAGKGIDCGMMPVFSHQEDDLDSFRTITCQLYTNGSAGQTQIAEAFGIKVQALKRGSNVSAKEAPTPFIGHPKHEEIPPS